MTHLLDLSLVEAREKLQKKEITSVELTQAYLDEMENKRHLNCYITETPDKALEMAKQADQNIQEGKSKKLEGIPLGIKDLYCTKDVKTTSASKMLSTFIPPYESTVTQNLWNEGSVMLGKLNMDEFAAGGSGRTSYYGPTENPWRSTKNPDTPLTAGGSSGGSSGAVAARLALATTGSDTGGSIRQPAAFTGTVGLKPTYGRCSRYGMISFASSLDQAGPITKTVEDAAALLEVMAGHDPKDATSADIPVPSYLSSLKQGIKGMKIGIPLLALQEEYNPSIKETWLKTVDILKDAGASIVEVDLPHIRYALQIYHIFASAELSSNLARFDGLRYGVRSPGKTLEEMYINSRTESFGHELKRRILMGTHVLSSACYEMYYLKAQKIRTKIIQDFENAWQKCDMLCTPTSPDTAFAINPDEHSDDINTYLSDSFAVPVNLAGLPAISVPAGLSDDMLPVGTQLIGRSFAEEEILRAAFLIEQNSDFQLKRF